MLWRHFKLVCKLSLTLVISGVMSGCYHVCPNHTNFQFDTAFMYTISILILLKIYQVSAAQKHLSSSLRYGEIS